MTKDPNTDISLVKQDITYIKRDLGEIKLRLDLVLDHYMQRDEIENRFSELNRQIDTRVSGAHERIKEKTDKEDFEKLSLKVEKHVNSGNIAWGGVAQSIITTVLTTAILGALAYSFIM